MDEIGWDTMGRLLVQGSSSSVEVGEAPPKRFHRVVWRMSVSGSWAALDLPLRIRWISATANAVVDQRACFLSSTYSVTDSSFGSFQLSLY